MRHSMRKYPGCALVPFALLLLTAPIGPRAHAQEETPEPPEETEIILPPEFFDFREAAPGEVEALLPELPPIEAPGVTLPLPEPSAEDGAVPAIRIPEPEELFREEAAPGGSSIFTTGTLGAGSVNYILGELALYKIGEDPRFRFEYLHRGLDGFAFNNPGTGHFERLDRLAGWVAAESEEGMSGELTATYREREIGFQGRPSFYSSEYRTIEGDLRFRYPLADRVAAYLQGELGYTNRLYTVKDPTKEPPESGESRVRPRVGVAFDFNRFGFDLYGRYTLRDIAGTPVPSVQTFAGGATASYELGEQWTLGAGMEVLREIDRSFLFPFFLSLGLDLEDRFFLELAGGMEYTVPTLGDLWQPYPFLAPGSVEEGELPSQEVWYGEGSLGWRPPFTGLEFELRGRYEERFRGMAMKPYEESLDVLPFETESREQLTGEFNTLWNPNARVELTAGVRSLFLDRHFLEPEHRGTITGDYLIPGRVWGARFDLSVPFYDELLLPAWNVEAYVRPIEAVEVRLGLDDILSPLLDEGRGRGSNEPSEEYPFVEPGFTVRLEARITL
ncbi:MAG: hypothetical protein ACOC25_01005 [Alkalispirochaetaceae bacterium]